MNPFISLCMIVKNEEKVLNRCIDSVKDIVDEMIIVDTGSTDKTKEIALNYVEEIFDFEWTDSFADARNFAQSKAKGKWILVMDADEYVDSDNLRTVIDELKNNDGLIDAFEVKIYNFTGLSAEKIVQHKSLRIYKNDPNIYYYRTIHEQLIRKNGELKTDASSLILYHSGYLSKTVQEKNKSKRNKMLIEKEIKKSGNTAFDYFNLGNEYLSIGEVEDALNAYITAYKQKADFRYSWVSFCIVQIIACLTRLERYQDALAVITDAEKVYDQSPDFKCLKANVFILQHRYKDAIEVLDELLQNNEHYQYPITSIDFLKFHPHQFLGKIYEILEDYEKAVIHNTKALNINNQSRDTLYNLISILSKCNSAEEIKEFLEQRQWIKTQQDIYSVIKIFVNLNQVSLAEEYLEKVENINVKSGFELKINILKGNYESVSNYIQKETVENLVNVVNTGCIDLYDLFVYGLETHQNNFLIMLYNLISDEKNKVFIKFILNESSTEVEENMYITLLERCIQMQKFDLFEELLIKKESFNRTINLLIGQLLYRYGFKDLSMGFYSEVDTNLYDEKTLVNLIEHAISQNEMNRAWEYTLYGINQGGNDFRLFEYALKLVLDFDEVPAEIEEIRSLAFYHYPESTTLIHLTDLLQDKLSDGKGETLSQLNQNVVGFFCETTFHYYVYESIINELLKQGVTCHLIINDTFESNEETNYMYHDLVNFIEGLNRPDISAFTISAIRDSHYKYKCMVSCYYSPLLHEISNKQVRTMYGMAKDFWNYSWWNVFYDKILCYSEYDYSKLNIYNNCSIVGNPKFDNWYRNNISNLEKVKQKFSLDDQKQTILYAPTYGNLSSIDDWIEEINLLQDDYNVIIKLHHGTALRESENERRNYIERYFVNVTKDTGDLFALFSICEFVITDNSGIIFDAMLAEKNILLLNPLSQHQIDVHNGGGILREKLMNINKGASIKSYLQDKKLFDIQSQFVKKYLNGLYKMTDGYSGVRAANEIIKLLEEDDDKDNMFLLSLREQIFMHS